jgi:translation initiation factor IF-1
MLDQQEKIIEGTVIKNLPNAMFRVKLADGKVLLCYLSGKMKLNHIQVLPGDKVKIETTSYDETKGRVVYRMK